MSWRRILLEYPVPVFEHGMRNGFHKKNLNADNMAPKRDYSKEQMIRAIEDVQRGEKVSVAATKYSVPRITLGNKVMDMSPLDCNLGPSTVLCQVLVK
ncbi:hypothetical protein evm_009385 [Chilo suppressalis]|nr:hypothetical protein evm_009385 [Chilo suppressalis]